MLLEISSSDVIKLSLIIYPSSSVVLGFHRHSTDDSRSFFCVSGVDLHVLIYLKNMSPYAAYRKIPNNKPWAYISLKGCFAGLIFW